MKPAPFLPRHRLGDIAAELGISETTVSRALSGKGRVSQATRDRIIECVRRLDESAQRGNVHPIMKRVIGLFTPWYSTGHGMRTSVSTSGIEVLRGVFEPRGYGVIFSSFGNPRQPTLGDDLLASRSLAGLVLFRTKEEENISAALPHRDLPHIFVSRNLHGTNLNYVGIDFPEAIGLAVRHCLDLDFEAIGLLSGDTSYPSHGAYRETFLRLLAKNKLRRNDAWIQQAELSESAGYEAGKSLLGGQKPPRALICSSDRLAYGVLRAATDLRKRVPRDLAVISLDGTPQAAYTHPALTVVRIPWTEMFSMAGSLLLDMIEGTSGLRQAAVQLRCELIVRESTAAVRSRRLAAG